MKKKNPLVSIIVRTKDRPKLLKSALQSITDQTYRPIEVVLVNDGGCDLEAEELKGILGDIFLNYIRLEENKGRSYAGNIGIENAQGEYIGFLDDDDVFYSEHIDTLVNGLSTNKYYKVAYTDSYLAFHEFIESSNEYALSKKECFYSEDFDRDRFLFENYIPFLCLLFEKNLLATFRLEEDLHAQEDWRLLTLISRDHEFLHINTITCQYNICGDSFVQYLENRHDIQKYASVVFEKNKEYINWKTWVNFKHRLENMVKACIVRKDYLEDEIKKYEDELEKYEDEIKKYKQEIINYEEEKYQNIEWMQNFLTQGMENILKLQSSSTKNQTLMLHKVYNILEAMNKVNNDRMDTIANAQNKINDRLNTIASVQNKINNGMGTIAITQDKIINRLSISEWIKLLAKKLKIST